jgi:hypothetical protein
MAVAAEVGAGFNCDVHAAEEEVMMMIDEDQLLWPRSVERKDATYGGRQ